MQDLLKNYPIVIEAPVAWGEMDALQHVNNTVYFRYFESVRIAYCEKIGVWEYMQQTGVGVILASTQCRYKIPLTYPDKVSVAAKVSKIETDRFLMDLVVVSQRYGKVAAEGDAMMVC
ncbi:MAG: acyl-CoA thioesterase, partial [Acidobacteriota bacterium]